MQDTMMRKKWIGLLAEVPSTCTSIEYCEVYKIPSTSWVLVGPPGSTVFTYPINNRAQLRHWASPYTLKGHDLLKNSLMVEKQTRI